MLLDYRRLRRKFSKLSCVGVALRGVCSSAERYGVTAALIGVFALSPPCINGVNGGFIHLSAHGWGVIMLGVGDDKVPDCSSRGWSEVGVNGCDPLSE